MTISQPLEVAVSRSAHGRPLTRLLACARTASGWFLCLAPVGAPAADGAAGGWLPVATLVLGLSLAVAIILLLRQRAGTGTTEPARGRGTGKAPEPPAPPGPGAATLDALLSHVHEAVLVLDGAGRVLRANPAAARLLGNNEAALMGLEFRSFLAQDAADPVAESLEAAREGRSSLRSRSGDAFPVGYVAAPVPAEAEGCGSTLLLLRDLSEADQSRRRIRFLTRYDALTRVANRMQFQHRLQQTIARAHRGGTRLALMYLDIDHFKDINDTFGHPVGDRSLEITARRLVDTLDPETMIGRLAGDEFGIVLDNLPRSEDVCGTLAATARNLLDRVAREFYVEHKEIFVTASIGIALCPDDADNVVDLIRNADAAMYHAKENGGNTYGFYAPRMNADAVDRLKLKNELRHAMSRDEFEVLYQPKIDLRDGRIAGAEALLRWRHPKRGEIPPAVFIPLAEDSNLIFEVGEWVLDRVCADYAGWQGRLAWPGRVAVNLSLQQLRQKDFVRSVEQIFERHRLTPSCLELEITESTLMRDGERTLRMLDRLYQLGLHLSIDDFGTGYSSLSALQHFPIGTLKIDQSFVHDAGRDPERGTIVTTIINMGQSLRMDVVAEGVETEEQLEFLRRNGCTYAQGHLFGSPLESADYLALLVEQQRGVHHLSALFA